MGGLHIDWQVRCDCGQAGGSWVDTGLCCLGSVGHSPRLRALTAAKQCKPQSHLVQRRTVGTARTARQAPSSEQKGVASGQVQPDVLHDSPTPHRF